jgi:hypothetical protein
MTAAFSVFANYGYRVPATPFLKVTDSKGEVLEELDMRDPDGEQVLDPGVAYQISSILSDNAARAPIFGPSSPLKINGIEAAAKTGTTNDWKDSWTMGYTPALAVGVWVGNNDGRPMAHVAGAIGAAPIWHNFIKTVYNDPKLKSRLLFPKEEAIPDKFRVPPGMVRKQVCAVSGMAPTSACRHLTWEWFTQANVPTEECDWHRWVPVTLRDGGASSAGPGMPPEETIERIFTFAPPEYRGWIGGGPPVTTTLPFTASVEAVPVEAVPLPTPLGEEPPSVAALVTPAAYAPTVPLLRPAGLQQPDPLPPIEGLQLAIWSPMNGQVVNGVVSVYGRVGATYFNRYVLEYGAGNGEAGMTALIDSPMPPVLDVLGLWNTEGLPYGDYTLRLTVETWSGEVARTSVSVRVGMPQPVVSIVSPADGSAVYIGEAVDIQVQADGGGAPIAGVEIYADGKRIASLLSPPWGARWAVVTGTHEFAAIAYSVTGEPVRAASVRVTSAGVRPTPTPTHVPVLWISNPTIYKEIQAGVNAVWVDVQPNSQVHHVDIYIDGFPAGYATGPGYRVNPEWTPTPGPTNTPEPTATLDPNAAATATVVQATAETQSTRVARASATRQARAAATATAKAGAASAAATAKAESDNATATVAAATASPTPAPPTETASPTPTATFVRYSKLPDPMLGDYVAQCMFTPGRRRVTAIGYDANNRVVGRNETWVVVK